MLIFCCSQAVEKFVKDNKDLEKQVEELKAKSLDFEALKKQADGAQKEYLRLIDEHSALQVLYYFAGFRLVLLLSLADTFIPSLFQKKYDLIKGVPVESKKDQ